MPNENGENRTPEEIARRNREQLELAQTPDNRWFAGEHYGHNPTVTEAFIYFCLFCQGAADYASERDRRTLQ